MAGKNIIVAVVGNIATITIDLSKSFGPSASGKTEIIATTSGNQPLAGTDVMLGVNAYRFAKRA